MWNSWQFCIKGIKLRFSVINFSVYEQSLLLKKPRSTCCTVQIQKRQPRKNWNSSSQWNRQLQSLNLMLLEQRVRNMILMPIAVYKRLWDRTWLKIGSQDSIGFVVKLIYKTLLIMNRFYKFMCRYNVIFFPLKGGGDYVILRGP